MTFNKCLKQSLLFREWLQKLKLSSNYDNLRSGGQLSLVGNTANIIQNKFMYLHKSLIYINNSFISPQISNLWPLFSEAAFSTVYSWRTKYNSNWQSFWKYYWGEAQGAKIIIFVWSVSYQTQTLGGLDWTPLPSCRLCLWYWAITQLWLKQYAG